MHPSEEQLNDYVDAALDPSDHQTVARHLEQCDDCTRFVAELQRIVQDAASLPPLTPPATAWSAIESTLRSDRFGKPRRSVVSSLRGGAAWALATAAAVVMAFLAGRVIEQREQREQTEQRNQRHQGEAVVANGATGVAPYNTSGDAANVRARVLLVAVGDHLERSQMVLVELANAQTQGELDISAERQWADELLASNRLYRQTAVQLGQTNVASVLDDLERVLVEVARGPSQVSMQQLAEIQQRIEAQGILFKVKIIGSEMRDRGNSTVPGKKLPVS
jgi:Putative zinc-finger